MFLMQGNGKTPWDGPAICIESLEDVDLYMCIIRSGKRYGITEVINTIKKLKDQKEKSNTKEG